MGEKTRFKGGVGLENGVWWVWARNVGEDTGIAYETVRKGPFVHFHQAEVELEIIRMRFSSEETEFSV